MTDHKVVLIVVVALALLSGVGLCGVIWLISVHSDPAALAVVAGLTGTALGNLGSLLVSTRSSPPAPPAPDPGGDQP